MKGWGKVNDLINNKLSGANKLLAEAKTIQQTKTVIDIATAAEVYARRQKLGEEAMGYAHEIKTYALRKLGEMLKATDRATGGQPYQRSTGFRSEPVKPTLAQLNLDKKTSSLAQRIADLPEDKLQEVAARRRSVRQAIREQREDESAKAKARAIKKLTTAAKASFEAVCDLRHCSFEELLSEVKPDVLITDPPYPKEFVPVYLELAKACASVPVVAVMCGQTYLPQIISDMCKHLSYRWMLAYMTPGGQAVQQWPRKINTFWKPVLLFGDTLEWVDDVCTSAVNDNDKEHHAWGQSESGMTQLVERLSKPKQLVCDPFLGGGTTAIVSFRLGRKFVGCDIDKTCVDNTRDRIQAELYRSQKNVSKKNVEELSELGILLKIAPEYHDGRAE